MTGLPASIESYLSDAGFSLTELTVLKKLLEGEALTLRELAAKTGKSTGVLDLAVKKLLTRRIIVRETVNDTGKLLLKSMDAILQWVRADTEEKLKSMKSRALDFETFIASLKRESIRPEMEYFEGPEGIQKAYLKLLDLKVKEFLHYRPVTMREEEDPLASFRVQYFRERHRRSIFSRVIAPDTSLGRRFQSRDPFEYRKTALLPEDVFPITFEKIIAGDTIACFHHAESRACFLKFPELARSEREMFELLWRRATEPPTQPQTVAVTLPTDPQPLIPLSTRTFSSLREFFLSRKSIALFTVCAVLAAGITFGLWRHTYNLNMQRERERAMSIVATGAMQFDAKDLDQLRTIDDVKKPEYAKVIRKLNEIRSKNERVAYAWIFRPIAGKEGYWEYVADADSLDPFAKIDANYDGVIDEKDVLQYPGLPYEEFDNYFEEGKNETFSTPDINIDQFGTYFTTSSPIRDVFGKTTAIFGVDILISQVSFLTQQSFSYLLVFVGFFLLFVFIRLAAFNRSLLQEILSLLKVRRVFVTLVFCAEIAFFVTLGLNYYTLNVIREEMGQKMMAIAATAATQFDPDDLNQLHWAGDMKTEAYQRVFKKLNEIRDNNHEIGIKWIYLLRPATEEYTWEFIADADANFYIPHWQDFNDDGLQTADELSTPPGMQNYQKETGISNKELALIKPLVDRTYTVDQWGSYLSASAPIIDRAGTHIAIIGVDAELSELLQAHHEKFIFSLWFTGALVLLLSIVLVVKKWK